MSPPDLLQAVLDDLGRAQMAGDWDSFLAGHALPFEFRTATALLVVTTEADLRAGFERYHGMLRGLNVTDYVRLVQTAREREPGLIVGVYETNMISGSHRVLPPFLSAMTLREVGGRWRAARIETELLNTRWPIGIPLPAPKGDDDG